MVWGESRPDTWVRLRSALPSLSAASRRLVSTGGKSETWVMPWRSIRRTASSGSKRGKMTLEAIGSSWERLGRSTEEGMRGASMRKRGRATR
jgi:hypothetical protein